MAIEGVKRFAVVLSLLEAMKSHDSWCGETHLQKCMYFLQEMLAVPTRFEYILYKHGPFSFELRDELATMRAHLLLALEGKPYPYGPSLSPGPSADALKERFPKTWRRYEAQIDFVADRISGRDVTDLERLATALYVTQEEASGSDVESRARTIAEIKPHITVEQARASVVEVDKLRQKSSSLIAA